MSVKEKMLSETNNLMPQNSRPVVMLVSNDYTLNSELESQLIREFGAIASIEKADNFHEALNLGYELQDEGHRIFAVLYFINGQKTNSARTFLNYLFVNSPLASCIMYSTDERLSMEMAGELSDCFPSIQIMRLPWGYNELNMLVGKSLEKFSAQTKLATV